MIDVKLLKRVETVYCHGHCPDGLASAMVLQDAFRRLGRKPRIVFLDYGTGEHKAAGIEGPSLFCDITPWRGTLASGSGRSPFGAVHPDTIVLDHHAGAEDIVRNFGAQGVYADAQKEPGVSGTVLAFREVWVPVVNPHWPLGVAPMAYEVAAFAECVGARDTWQTDAPDGRFERGQWITRMLMSRPASYWLGGHVPYLDGAEIAVGRELHEQHLQVVASALEQLVAMHVPDGDGLVELFAFQEQAQGFRLTSDVAEALRERGRDGPGVVAGFAWFVDSDGVPKLTYSLRSLGDFDVCAFAKANGGGGHRAAAGFSVAPKDAPEIRGERWLPDPYAVVRVRLAAHLGDAGRRP